MAKIMVAVDSSASFTGSSHWEYINKIVNETVKALSNQNEVQVAKIGAVLHLCTLDEFNAGWNVEHGDCGGFYEEKLLDVAEKYDSVLLITDGFVDVKALQKPNISLMILEDPDYVENPLPIVGFLCKHCDKEKGLHKSKDHSCPTKNGYFSNQSKFESNLSKPVRRFTL